MPRLRSWATDNNPLYRDGLAVLAASAKADMDAGSVPKQDSGGVDSWEQYATEMYAELFAFMSLISNDQANRDDYARTGWDTDATWFTYQLGWTTVDH